MSEQEPPKTDPPTTDPPKEDPVDPSIDDDPFLKLLANVADKDKEVIINTVNMLTQRVNTLEKEAKDSSDKSDTAAKKIIIDMLKAAGYDITGLENKSLQSLQDTAELLGQKNNKIIITKKEDDSNSNPDQNKTRMWDHDKKEFYYWEDRHKPPATK